MYAVWKQALQILNNSVFTYAVYLIFSAEQLRLEKEGEFPQRRKITKRTVGWLASEIEDWINGREAKGSDSPETAGFGRRKSMAGGANGHNR